MTVLRGIGAPFELREGLVGRIRSASRCETAPTRRVSYRIELLDAGGARLIAPENPLAVAAGEQRSTSLFVMADPASLPHGRRTVRFRVSDESGFETTTPYEVLGPDTTPALGSAR